MLRVLTLFFIIVVFGLLLLVVAIGMKKASKNTVFLAFCLCTLSTTLIVFYGVLLSKGINTFEDLKPSNASSITQNPSGVTANAPLSTPSSSTISITPTNTVQTSAEYPNITDYFDSFVNDSSNIGQTVCFNVVCETVQQNGELPLSLAANTDYWTIMAINAQEISVKMWDEAVFTGRFEGFKYEFPCFDTINLDVLGNRNPEPIVGDSDRYANYELIAIKSIDEYNKEFVEASGDGIGAIFKLQIILYTPETKMSGFYFYGDETPIYGYGEINIPLQPLDWVYVDAIYHESLPSPPYSPNTSGLTIYEVTKIE